MPTRISAGVHDHPCFLNFIYIIPIDCKITNFSLYLFVSFLKDYHNYFFVHAQLLISGKPVSQYTSYSLIFSPLHSIINGEQHKSMSIINLPITEIMEYCLLLAVQTCYAAFQAKKRPC